MTTSLLRIVLIAAVAAGATGAAAGCGGSSTTPSGDGGAGGDGGGDPGVDGGGPVATDPDAIARACALAVSCGGPHSMLPPNTCYEAIASLLMQDQIADPLRCAAATDCASYLTCATRGHDGSWCSGHLGGACDGDVAVNCFDQRGAGLVEDCGALGLTCVAPTPGALAYCSDDEACGPRPPDGYQPACATAARLIVCTAEGDARRVFSCADDTECAVIESPSGTLGACLPVGRASCTTDGESRCDGDIVQTCTSAGEVPLDCAAVRRTCQLGAPTRAVCVTDECTRNSGQPWTCDADVLVGCSDAGVIRIACADLGLTTCDAADGLPRCR